jgi:acetyl esterase/lipase
MLSGVAPVATNGPALQANQGATQPKHHHQPKEHTSCPKPTHLNPAYPTTFVPDLLFTQVTNERGEAEDLHLDLYLPDDGTGDLRPAVIWFHGGGFRPGNDRRQAYIPRFARAFAERGYAGIAPDYRVREDPGTDWEGSIQDAVADGQAVLSWLRKHAHEYRIDPKHVALAGGSAGGVLMHTLCHAPMSPGPYRPDELFALISLWGPPFGALPINPQAPPTLLVHGTADALAPYALSEQLLDRLTDAGVPASLLTLPDAPHTPLMHMEQIVSAVASFLQDALGRRLSHDK